MWFYEETISGREILRLVFQNWDSHSDRKKVCIADAICGKALPIVR